MIFRTRKVSPQTNRGWFLLVSNWKMVELLLITTSKRSQHFTWFWDFGEELWLRWRLWQEKKLRLILNQLIPLIGSRNGLRRKKEFLLFSKGFIFFIFKYYLLEWTIIIHLFIASSSVVTSMVWMGWPRIKASYYNHPVIRLWVDLQCTGFTCSPKVGMVPLHFKKNMLYLVTNHSCKVQKGCKYLAFTPSHFISFGLKWHILGGKNMVLWKCPSLFITGSMTLY